jgi:hypothetical protein
MTMFTSAGVPPPPPSEPDVSEELLDEDEDDVDDDDDELELEDVEATFVVKGLELSPPAAFWRFSVVLSYAVC